jgi:hypothetical protein
VTDDARDRATAILAGLADEEGRREISAGELMPAIYGELRCQARGFMARERHDHTLHER